MKWPWWRKPAPEVFICEICRGEGVQRRGAWDYCPRGHTYVAERSGL